MDHLSLGKIHIVSKNYSISFLILFHKKIGISKNTVQSLKKIILVEFFHKKDKSEPGTIFIRELTFRTAY